MKITLRWWYPSELERVLPKEVEIGEDKHFKTLEHFVQYVNGWGLNLAFPKDFSKTRVVIVDTKFFYQR